MLASDELPTVLMEETGAIVEGLSEALSQEDAGSPAVAAFVDALPLCEAVGSMGDGGVSTRATDLTRAPSRPHGAHDAACCRP